MELGVDKNLAGVSCPAERRTLMRVAQARHRVFVKSAAAWNQIHQGTLFPARVAVSPQTSRVGDSLGLGVCGRAIRPCCHGNAYISLPGWAIARQCMQQAAWSLLGGVWRRNMSPPPAMHIARPGNP
jgi:hypothetical protein